MQYVFLIRSSAGCKKYVTRRGRVTYFLPPARQRIKYTYCMGKRPFLFLLLIYMRFLTIFYAKTMELSFAAVVRHYDSERVCHRACSYIQSNRRDRLRLTHFHFEWFSVVLRLNAHELLAFVFFYIFVEYTLPRQSPIANRVLHKRQRKLIDVIDRHVMIFLTTYFRTTPMADVNFTSLVTSLITCHHCVSFTVALVICKSERIYVTSGAASVYFDDADNATCKSRVGLPYSVQSGLFSASAVNVREAH